MDIYNDLYVFCADPDSLREMDQKIHYTGRKLLPERQGEIQIYIGADADFWGFGQVKKKPCLVRHCVGHQSGDPDCDPFVREWGGLFYTVFNNYGEKAGSFHSDEVDALCPRGGHWMIHTGVLDEFEEDVWRFEWSQNFPEELRREVITSVPLNYFGE